MNSTNRFLNRAFVLIVGLVLFVAGGAVAVGALLPDVQRTVSQSATDSRGPATDALGAQPWILWVVAVVALVLIVMLLWFVLRQGRGHTRTLVTLGSDRRAGSRRAGSGSGGGAGTFTGAGTVAGTVTVDASVAQHVLEDALSRTPDVASVDVTAFRVRRENVLRITVQARRGASPEAIRSAADQAVAQWDAAFGTVTPVVVQIVAGLRTRLTGAPSRVD